MNFVQAIQSGFQNYVTFSGRAQRSAYWWWALFSVLVQVIAESVGGEIIGFLVALAVLLPTIAVSVRRLHDIDRTGWWILVSLVPILGWILWVYWACCKGTDGPNRFGPDPLALPPDMAPAADA